MEGKIILYVTSIAVVAGCRINEIYSFEFFGKLCLVKGNVIELSYKPAILLLCIYQKKSKHMSTQKLVQIFIVGKKKRNYSLFIMMS